MKKFSYIIAILLFLTTTSSSGLLMTRDEALNRAFPGNTGYKKINIILNDSQVEKIEELSRFKLDSKIYLFYKFTDNDQTLGYAILDTHLLRTKSETVMFMIGPDGNLLNIEILAFFEPSEYMQSESWLNIFKDRKLDSELRIDRNIPNITGATITSHAFTESVRKVLAIYQVAVKEATNG